MTLIVVIILGKQRGYNNLYDIIYDLLCRNELNENDSINIISEMIELNLVTVKQYDGYHKVYRVNSTMTLDAIIEVYLCYKTYKLKT